MMYSLYFEIAATANKKNVLEIFFKDWIDRICNNEVRYAFEDGSRCDNSPYTLRVDFLNQEDAVAMKLKGIPEELKKYIRPW